MVINQISVKATTSLPWTELTHLPSIPFNRGWEVLHVNYIIGSQFLYSVKDKVSITASHTALSLAEMVETTFKKTCSTSWVCWCPVSLHCQGISNIMIPSHKLSMLKHIDYMVIFNLPFRQATACLTACLKSKLNITSATSVIGDMIKYKDMFFVFSKQLNLYRG